MAKSPRMIFSLSAETRAKLDELAASMDMKAAEVIRALIKRAHRQLKSPGAPAPDSREVG